MGDLRQALRYVSLALTNCTVWVDECSTVIYPKYPHVETTQAVYIAASEQMPFCLHSIESTITVQVHMYFWKVSATVHSEHTHIIHVSAHTLNHLSTVVNTVCL